MKKIKLLVITLFLLACFAGNALANPAYGKLLIPGTTTVISNPAPVKTGSTVSYGLAWDTMSTNPSTGAVLAQGSKVYYFLGSDLTKSTNSKTGSFSFYAPPVAGTGALDHQLLVTVSQTTGGITSGYLDVLPVQITSLGDLKAPYYVDPANVRITLTLPTSGVAQGAMWNIGGNGGICADFVDIGVGTLETGSLEYITYNSVPEFPTIALPVAGLLGILFVFGRKKGDM